MKLNIKQEKGITMTALVLTVITLLILTNVMIYNTQSSIDISKLTNLYSDIELLRDKVSAYYDEYGKIPAKIEYKNTSGLSNVQSTKNDIGKFYVIDLEAMQGITLNYGKDYEIVKDGKKNPDNYTDLYIINENSHNIFYVEGIQIKENDVVNKYYTDYTQPDETTIDLRYIEGILIPDGYYYIGKTKDANENESIVISNVQGETLDVSKTNQYVWTTQSSEIGKKPSDITLEDNQQEYQFVKSVNTNKGYFKNTAGKVQYTIIDEEKWSEAYTKEIEYEDSNGDKVTIPEGFRVSMSPTMNTVEKGLVVKDSNDNEWVWVEVPRTIFITAKNLEEYDKIKADLIAYASDYREGSEGQGYNWTDEWYDGCGVDSAEEYTEMYQKMLSSVYTNGGFWISRYEIGIKGSDIDTTKARTDSSSRITDETILTVPEAVSQANMIPYNYVYCSEAQALAKRMSTDTSKTSSLLFGIQWDLTCKFLESNSNLAKADIKSDSTNWGNYQNATVTQIKNGVKQFISGTWTVSTADKSASSVLLTTGASEYIKKMNIYDFAGNEWEWTLEHATSNTDTPCAFRGGGYGSYGSVNPASLRHNSSKTYSNDDIGFHSALY